MPGVHNGIHLSAGPAAALGKRGCPYAGSARPGPRQTQPLVILSLCPYVSVYRGWGQPYKGLRGLAGGVAWS